MATEIYTPKTKVAVLYPLTGGLIFLASSYTDVANSTCDSGKRFFIPTTHPNYNTMVSLLTAAFMANKDVELVYTPPTTPQCGIEISRFKVYP